MKKNYVTCSLCNCKLKLNQEVYLHYTNSFDINNIVDDFGQRLLPREEWGDDCNDYDY